MNAAKEKKNVASKRNVQWRWLEHCDILKIRSEVCGKLHRKPGKPREE